ncbi:54S ribosomal protein img2, mitochondrial [Elasticomyces elasticus]|nr:54S ribosomal protein img2, mitochondrial [Elasticomyces elasticus]
MASTLTTMSFLRPLGLPRPATVRHFLRFSTTTQCREAQAAHTPPAEDPNLIASRQASASYPPSTLKSLPRPKESKASHRTKYPRAEREYPTRHPVHTGAKATPAPLEPLPTEQCAPNLAYFVTRTPSKELPVYQLTKRGGNLKITRVRKIDGRREVLRDELRTELGLQEKDAVVNAITGHVVLKGWWKKEVTGFLARRRF